MKLNETRPNIEMSGELEEQFFSIKDQGMIFDILRNKMYSNPILAICREITCNARDAHREVNKADVPIVINLPNSLEAYFKVKDFGPGISPERMSNVFIQYTASTKRQDNVQTGGFGLGAKTPFSYSDSFNIVTNVNGIQYNYSCFIDETKVGKLLLLSESKTKEPNGTEIIVPIKPADFRSFADWTESSVRHWEVKPIIRGGREIKWVVPNQLLAGTGWAIESNTDWNRNTKLIIDGIEYPLDLTSLRTYADSKVIDSIKGNLFLYFGVGELSLSASREQVYLDKMTQEKIKEKLKLVNDELKIEIGNRIEKCDNLWDANVFMRKELNQKFQDIAFLGTMSWRGIALNKNAYLHTGTDCFTFQKGKYNSKTKQDDPTKLRRVRVREIWFEDNENNNCELYFNDIGLAEPTPKHIKKAFDSNDKLKKVHIISPNSTHDYEKINKETHLDKMGIKFLSSITKAVGKAYTTPTSRLLVFHYDNIYGGFKQVSYSSMEEDTKIKVLCMLNKSLGSSDRFIVLKNKKHLTCSGLNRIIEKYKGYSFYGVDTDTPEKRIKDDLKDCISLEKFIESKVVSDQKDQLIKLKYMNNAKHELDSKIIKEEKSYHKLITNPKSDFLKNVNLQVTIATLTAESAELHLYEALKGDITKAEIEKFLKDNPELNLTTLNNVVLDKYPMLKLISSYNFSYYIKDICEYINLVDKG